jgi:hypothetical protein
MLCMVGHRRVIATALSNDDVIAECQDEVALCISLGPTSKAAAVATDYDHGISRRVPVAFRIRGRLGGPDACLSASELKSAGRSQRRAQIYPFGASDEIWPERDLPSIAAARRVGVDQR